MRLSELIEALEKVEEKYGGDLFVEVLKNARDGKYHQHDLVERVAVVRDEDEDFVMVL